MPYTRRAYVQINRYGTVYLFNVDGVWIGPGLGNFRTTSDAKRWGRANGYTVAHKIQRES
jgi:hypothetical protein